MSTANMADGKIRGCPRWRMTAVGMAAAIGAASASFAMQARADGPTVPPVTVGDEIQISGPSPFGGCTADDVATQELDGSVVYPNSEIEPYIDINPVNPANLVAVFQQDRWSDGGARGVASTVSDDGGATWAPVTPPPFFLCAGATSYERATDPWVTYAPNGDVYFQSLSFDSDPNLFGGNHALLVSKSTDGGHTWGPVVVQLAENDPNVFNDKNSMTADPTGDQRIYAIWDRLELFTAAAQQAAVAAAATGDGRDKVRLAGQALRALRLRAATSAAALPEPPQSIGPTLFTRTVDGGRTWSRPVVIYDPGGDNQTIGNLIEVQPDGTLFAFFTEILLQRNGTFRANISFKRSLDHGFTFQPTFGRTIAQRIFTLGIDNAVGTFTPDLREPVRDAGILFDSAVDPRNGNLYLVWQDNRFSFGAFDEIAFSMSTNDGQRWSRPIKISQAPRLANRFRQAAFVPTIAVNADGIVAVTYYDFRNDDGTGELADQFALFCNPNSSDCAKRGNWGSEQRLTEESFDILDAPVARGHFLGDYMGSESVTSDVHPAYGLPDGADQTSIYTRKLSIAPAVAAATN